MGGFFTLSIPELRRRCQAIAVLDAIASPEWEGRRYSWNPSWDDGEQVLEGRDGQGDSLLILFRDENMAINLFSMEGQLVDVIPGAFEKFFLGEPVATLGTDSSLTDGIAILTTPKTTLTTASTTPAQPRRSSH